MAHNRKTSAGIASKASKLLKRSQSNPVKSVAGSALSQRAPKKKK